ncbi:MAG: hypothetical protein JNL70_01485 [Saprospiraceae bacterium]|nr:hypothetical protein [Saprospiraceae bacterium]
MPKHLLLIALILFLPKNVFSENFKYIDSLSLRLTEQSVQSLEDLVSYCEQYTQSDVARVRFYFVWVATHIQYDESLNTENQSPEQVFSNKKAICSGYSRLFAFLCAKSGMAARYVSGYAKETNDVTSIQNHAWNIVRIDGQWQAFDVTWAANELEESSEDSISPAFETWFMPEATLFQATHLPFDPAFQLTSKLVSRAVFFGDKSTNTEGGILLDSVAHFTDILNKDLTLDSIEQACRSFQRAYDFMPMDSAVAIKLVKAQEFKVKQSFEYVFQYKLKNYRDMPHTSTEILRGQLSKLQALDTSLTEAIVLHKSLVIYPLSPHNRRMLEYNQNFFEELWRFYKVAKMEIDREINSRQSQD